MTELKQKRGTNFRNFKLTPSKVIVETRSIRKNDKYEVKLEKLGFDIHYRSDNTQPGIIAFWVFILIIVGATIEHFTRGSIDTAGLIAIWAFCIGFCLLNYFKQHEDDIYLKGGQVNLVFYRNKPDEETVLQFIEEVKEQTRSFFKEKYTAFDAMTTEQDFYGRIMWLREQDIISQAEFDVYRESFDTQRLF